MTFDAPLKTLVRLLTRMSAYGRTSTFTKFPMVSSITIKKSYLSARTRRRGRFADRRSGFEGNSVKRARTGGFVGSRLDSTSRIFSSSSISESIPKPRKWHPGPHFSRTLRVSVYVNLILHRSVGARWIARKVNEPKTDTFRWRQNREGNIMCTPNSGHSTWIEIHIFGCDVRNASYARTNN